MPGLCSGLPDCCCLQCPQCPQLCLLGDKGPAEQRWLLLWCPWPGMGWEKQVSQPSALSSLQPRKSALCFLCAQKGRTVRQGTSPKLLLTSSELFLTKEGFRLVSHSQFCPTALVWLNGNRAQCSRQGVCFKPHFCPPPG